MHSLLSILFSFGLAVLVYGFSLFPAASLMRPDDPDELASLIDGESASPFADDRHTLSPGHQPNKSG
jgi:hypothetical protein